MAAVAVHSGRAVAGGDVRHALCRSDDRRERVLARGADDAATGCLANAVPETTRQPFRPSSKSPFAMLPGGLAMPMSPARPLLKVFAVAHRSTDGGVPSIC
jgi:hypothetical protein